jgi:cobalamin biosynthesis protein CobD/CbiB
MAENARTPILIGVLVGLGAVVTGVVYFFALSLLPGGAMLRWVVLAVTVVVLVPLAAVVRSRIRELKKEDMNDYRNY